jgi:hypothetical protein
VASTFRGLDEQTNEFQAQKYLSWGNKSTFPQVEEGIVMTNMGWHFWNTFAG